MTEVPEKCPKCESKLLVGHSFSADERLTKLIAVCYRCLICKHIWRVEE